MENIIKNIHLLTLNLDDKARLEAGAKLYKRHANIEFKVLKLAENTLTIRTHQSKNFSDKYLTEKELIERTNSLFNGFADAIKFEKIIVHPMPYIKSNSEIITPDYLKRELQRRKLRIKDIQLETGLETSNISSWVNGVRPMSNIVKNMFYYYFKSNQG